ncbi:3-oxoacyl-ACP synthase III family protein [Streptomyces arenae]|uniref:3-oxoacyl-ACP synthase III family protein n=1 Tax=Streptomyces arenae TaxID=29301 RepID=UPI0026592E60|nr:3-oxoacyl-[acyl-carrier-protein] synthase III C-terminal domain-containing protein [Streptomyces arenae]MCG7204948.1 3-oxoacyl-ACP synthase [Streptomyces arenae]
MTYGIVALAHTLGAAENVIEAAPRYTADLERIRDWGYRGFHRAEDAVGVTDLAVSAGAAALAKANLTADEVDLLVLAIPDLSEHLYWDAAAACQAGLGATRAEAVLVNQACSGGVVAFDLLAGRFATHPDYRVALLVTASRVCETYKNRMESDTSVASDGAVAAVAVRDHDACRWLVTETISDGRYAQFALLPGGGTAQPFSPRHSDPGVLASPFDRMQDHFGRDVRTMLEYARRVQTNTREVIDRACKRAQVDFGEVRHVLHLNENAKALRAFARDLGLDLERTNAELAMEHGHLGTADQLFALQRLLDDGRLDRGELVALTSTGTGMHWACTILRT